MKKIKTLILCSIVFSYCFSTATIFRQRTSKLRYTYTVCLNRPGFLLASNNFSVISCVVPMFSYSKYINIPVSSALRQSVFCRNSSVGIATRYRLHGPGFECWRTRDFPHLFRPALGPTQRPIQWVPDLFLRDKAAGRGVNNPPSYRPRLKKQ